MPRGVSGGGPKPHLNLETFDSKTVSGQVKPGTKVEARNVSRGSGDSFTQAGADGHFEMKISSRRGETIELQLQTPDQGGQSSVFVRNEGKNAWSTVTPPDFDGDGMDVDLPMPEPTREHMDVDGESKFEVAHLEGPLFIDGVKVDDVLQGKINNCYFACGLSLLAHYRPEAIQDAIRVQPDGNFEVTILEGKYRPQPVKVTVNSDLFVDEDGGPIYTHSESGELWPMILEKAYAEHKGYGSYENIGQGGKAGDVVRAFTGEPYMMLQMEEARSHEEIFDTIRDAVENGRPASAGTHSEKSRYEGVNLYANHNYAVLGTGYDEDTGEPYLVLRNPWGQSEPDYHGAQDGVDDGIFKINMEDFANYFMTYSVITEGGRRRGR
ncbi:MAG: C2 family cysteine protease [Myxococcota bacterium]|nr:C2 family cysteine protease [Myxococcota bacterium]